MKVRPARFADAFELVDILCEQHLRSRYATSTEVDREYTRKLLSQAIQRHGGQHDGAALVTVVEGESGRIEAFFVGVLDRIYHIMRALRAQDMFLVAREGASPLALRTLLSSYFDWAGSIPAVHEIYLSHTDVLPEGDRMGRLYERMGFSRCGAIYRRTAVSSNVRNAA